MKRIYYFDKINPIDKFLLISKNEEKRKVAEKLLIALYIINKVIRENANINYSYYLNNDLTLKTLLKKSLKCDIPNDIFMEALIKLDICKLIYRFTTAKKFKIKDKTIKQLRINSWGNEYIKDKKILELYKNEFEQIYNYLNQYYNDNRHIYSELLENLLLEINDERAELIQKLNENVEVKLLS